MENRENWVMYLKGILKSTESGDTSGREGQFFLKCENFRKGFYCPSTSIVASTFSSNHLLDILICVFSIFSLKWIEESEDEGFASESTHSFWKPGEITSKTQQHYLGAITLVLGIPENSAWEGFPLVPLIFYRFCNVFYL